MIVKNVEEIGTSKTRLVSYKSVADQVDWEANKIYDMVARRKDPVMPYYRYQDERGETVYLEERLVEPFHDAIVAVMKSGLTRPNSDPAVRNARNEDGDDFTRALTRMLRALDLWTPEQKKHKLSSRDAEGNYVAAPQPWPGDTLFSQIEEAVVPDPKLDGTSDAPWDADVKSIRDIILAQELTIKHLQQRLDILDKQSKVFRDFIVQHVQSATWFYRNRLKVIDDANPDTGQSK